VPEGRAVAEGAEMGATQRGLCLLSGLGGGCRLGQLFHARGLRAEREAARQVTGLRSAELAAHSGHWREALQHLEEAEAAGYGMRLTWPAKAEAGQS